MSSTSALKSKMNTIEEPTKNEEIWAFTDMECWVDKKIALKWNTLFQAFQTKEFQVLLQDDPSTKLNKGIYKNISKFGQHRVATKNLVLQCSDVI